MKTTRVRHVDPLTVYYTAMVEMYETKKFKAIEILGRYNISMALPRYLMQMGLIEKSGTYRTYTWIGKRPTKEKAKICIELQREYGRNLAAEARQKRNEMKQQEQSEADEINTPEKFPDESGDKPLFRELLPQNSSAPMTEDEMITYLKTTGKYKIYKLITQELEL